jgi:hypothetical protein
VIDLAKYLALLSIHELQDLYHLLGCLTNIKEIFHLFTPSLIGYENLPDPKCTVF